MELILAVLLLEFVSRIPVLHSLLPVEIDVFVLECFDVFLPLNHNCLYQTQIHAVIYSQV